MCQSWTKGSSKGKILQLLTSSTWAQGRAGHGDGFLFEDLSLCCESDVKGSWPIGFNLIQSHLASFLF